MGQVNVTYDDRILAGIDRVCGARGLSRTELLRAIANEAVEAHDAGTLAFHSEGPRLEGSVNALTLQMREAVIELDRVQRSTQRHEKRMLESWVASAEAIRVAEEHLVGRINDINRKSYEPFVVRLTQLQASFGEAAERMAAQQTAQHTKLDERLEAVRAQAASPRNLYKVVFPGDFSIGYLTALTSMIGMIGALIFIFFAANLEWLGVPVARKLLPTTELICNLVNERYGVRDCEVPAEYRHGPVRAARAGK